MIVNGGPVPKVLVAGRAAVLRAGTEVDLAHVPSHVDQVANAPPANHADEAPVAGLHVALDELLHRSYKGRRDRESSSRAEQGEQEELDNGLTSWT